MAEIIDLFQSNELPGFDIPDGAEIVIPTTEIEMAAVQKVSDYVVGLPLDAKSNNRLVELMTEAMGVTKKETFTQGLSVGARLANEAFQEGA